MKAELFVVIFKEHVCAKIQEQLHESLLLKNV